MNKLIEILMSYHLTHQQAEETVQAMLADDPAFQHLLNFFDEAKTDSIAAMSKMLQQSVQKYDQLQAGVSSYAGHSTT